MSTTQEQTGFPCGNCGAQLSFTPGQSQLTCPYCDHVQDIPGTNEPAEIKEHDYLTALSNPALVDVSDINEQAKEVECTNCGAATIISGAATSCPFCDSPMVIKESKEGMILPESLLPFVVEENKAQETFKTWIASRWFAPNDLVQKAQNEGMDGVYLPYWTYDSETRTEYRGERGEHYYVEEEYTDSDGKTQTRRERKTRWYSAEGRIRRSFDDVMVCASKSLPQKLFDGLEPWPTKELKPYNPGYLAGFSAERYAISLKEGFSLAEKKMDAEIRKAIKRDIGGDEQRIHRVDTRHDDITYKLVFLPLWISSFRYNEKVYRFLINAQTGEANGERPYSVIKIVLTVLAVIGFFALMAYMNG